MKQQSTATCIRQDISHTGKVSAAPQAQMGAKKRSKVHLKSWLLNFSLMLTANKIIDVQISPPSPVRLLSGHTLVLNCTATTALNTRVQMTWSYPGKVSDLLFYFLWRTLFLASEPRWVFEMGKSENSDSYDRVTQRHALGWVGCVPGLVFHGYDMQTLSFDVGGFEVSKLLFLLHDSGRKKGLFHSWKWCFRI